MSLLPCLNFHGRRSVSWQIIKTIVNGEYNKKETVNEISVEGVQITDKKLIATNLMNILPILVPT